MMSAVLALVLANSPWAEAYGAALDAHIGPLSVLHVINDGLMTLFFLLVGLEIKRELLDGHLRQWSARVLPGFAALGGMIVPSFVYGVFNASSPETLQGWAIPASTDIAFALGALALLGNRVPVSLKIFLTALAILDDIGAVVIIALYYSSGVSAPALLGAGVMLFYLLGLNLFNVRILFPYLILGAGLWLFMANSGVHATLAGVLLAAAVPLRLPGSDDEDAPLHRLENALHSWVAYGVVPLFGFANAGVSLDGMGALITNPSLFLGIGGGLFLGKQLGVFISAAFVIKVGLASRPRHASWMQLYGVAVLCGVGFTMSLFIGSIAFGSDGELMAQTKIGVLAGSLLSIVLGVLFLYIAEPERGTIKQQ